MLADEAPTPAPAVPAVPVAPPTPAPVVKPAPTGAEIYQQMCAECHGKKGEGVQGKYDDPLIGDRSVESLAKLIDRTMPDGEPEKSTPEEARLVAAYIHEAFYSPAARARNNPPKYELARLTNRQFRESVADVIGSFRSTQAAGKGTGLHAQLFQSDGMNKKKKMSLEREDAAIDFDFGAESPGGDINPEQFSIAWSGSLLAPKSGVYEFRVSTPNGARVYLNVDSRGDTNRRDDSDGKREATLIDAWVSSGDNVRVESGKAYLLGGRSYPFKVDYFKYKEKRGLVKLEWKPPGGVWSVLAAPYLSPSGATHVAVVDAPFPPDDGSFGFERGTSVSKEWHEATTKAAVAASVEVMAHLYTFSGTKPDAPDRTDKIKQFAATFAERAFRRPLTPEMRQLYIDRIFTDGLDPEVAMKRAVIAILKSPRFLYPDLGEDDDCAIAARLALNLWDSIPDTKLLEAAKKGEVHTIEQVRAQAVRMALDPRAQTKLLAFFQRWLGEDDIEDLSKDGKLFPGFDPLIISDLRRSLDRFVEYVVSSERSDFRDLLLADYLFVNPRLAKYYGMTAPTTNDFELLHFDGSQRAGIFTHPFLLSAYSYAKSTSPIHRGVFLTRKVMGRVLKQPPMAVKFEDEQFDPSLTMREKVTQLTRKESCMGCHGTINPLGFTLEGYDAVGRFRTKDNNKPVDVNTDYHTAEGDVVKLHGARDLAEYAAKSEVARQNFVKQLFHYEVKQTPALFGGNTLEVLDKGFADSGDHMRKLFTEIAVRGAMPRPQAEEQKQANR